MEKFCAVLVMSLALVACSSGSRRGEFASDASPKDEIAKLDSEIQAAMSTKQEDVVAAEDLDNSQKYLDKAKKEEKSEGKIKTVWQDLATSRDYLNKAEKTYERNHADVDDVLRARQAALESGARNNPGPRKELKRIDDLVRSNIKNLNPGHRENQTWEAARQDYERLEVRSVQEVQLGNARAMVDQAKKDGARVHSPKSLQEAEFAIKAAQDQIAGYLHNPQGYSEYVTRANLAAKNLVAVNAASRHVAGETDEAAAREAVAREQQVGGLNAELKGAETESALKGRALVEKETELRGVAGENENLEKDKRINETINSAQKEFSKDEAEVYRQGDKLLIRLKKMNFPSGRAELPTASMDLLAKVRTLIKDLNASDVVVEGHTDSLGTPSTNKALSKKRADSVATYLKPDLENANVEAVGLADEKPLTSNKTKSGRAMNRRVDLVITPGTKSM